MNRNQGKLKITFNAQEIGLFQRQVVRKRPHLVRVDINPVLIGLASNAKFEVVALFERQGVHFLFFGRPSATVQSAIHHRLVVREAKADMQRNSRIVIQTFLQVHSEELAIAVQLAFDQNLSGRQTVVESSVERCWLRTNGGKSAAMERAA